MKAALSNTQRWLGALTIVAAAPTLWPQNLHHPQRIGTHYEQLFNPLRRAKTAESLVCELHITNDQEVR